MAEPALPHPARPHVHYTPRANWMNDPNGLIHHRGVWHLFYQHNPFATDWGHMSWGHATSTNLLHWHEQPLAIAEDADGAIFSGSIVADPQGRAGFGPDALVAIYTAHRPAGPHGTPQHQAQCLAHSQDDGRSWTKFAGNPVLDAGLAEFRDPKVFWHEPTGRWIMAVARSDLRQVEFHASADLHHWTHCASFGPAGTPGRLWECPDLFPLAAPDGSEHWVLKVDVFEGAAAGGSGALAFIGQFDGTSFHPDPAPDGTPRWQWVDHGRDFYAAVSWTGAPAGRRVWIGWMNSHHYAAHLPPVPWRGAMTLPRGLALTTAAGTLALTQRPTPEWDAARHLHTHLTNLPVDPSHPLDLTLPGTPVQEIALRFAAGPACLHIALHNAAGEHVVITHDPAHSRLTLNRTATGTLPGIAAWAGPVHAPLATLHDLRLVLDNGSIELFANGGIVAITELLLGGSHATRLSLHSTVPCRLDELNCYTVAVAGG